MTQPTDRTPKDRRYWLDDSRNVDKVFWTLCLICLLLFGADALYTKTVHFPFEAWFGFFGIFGFIACVGLVLTAKELRRVLKRDEDYYDR
jgi:hypothetical protein